VLYPAELRARTGHKGQPADAAPAAMWSAT
jgi:hypothetical protein